MQNIIKLISEIGPLIGFFVAYKLYGIITATWIMIAVTLVTVVISFIHQRKIPYVPLISAIVLAVVGSLTIISGDSSFIKLKPTIVNLLFSLVLFAGVGFKKGLIKYIFNNTIQLSDKNWIKFSTRFAIFFLFLAILNEIIWRNFTEDFWVKFKVFGMLPITFLFITSQLPFLYKNKIEEEKES